MKNTILSSMTKTALFCILVVLIIHETGRRVFLVASPPEDLITSAPESNAIATEIRNTIDQMGYSGEVASNFLKMIKDWDAVAWKERVVQARKDLHEKKISRAQAALKEENVIRELNSKIQKEFATDGSEDKLSNDLSKIVIDKKSFCFGNCQILYILGLTEK